MPKIYLSHKQHVLIQNALKTNNWSMDAAFSDVVSKYNLFGVAYFGYKPTKYQRRLLTYLWRGVMFNQLEFNKNLRDWQKEQLKKALQIK